MTRYVNVTPALPFHTKTTPNHPTQFFTKLADIFTSRKTKAHGAVFLTQKRCKNLPSPTPNSHLTPP